MSTVTEDQRIVRVAAATVVARAICRSHSRHPDCICRGEASRCHAAQLYDDFAVAAVLGLEKAGFVLTKGD